MSKGKIILGGLVLSLVSCGIAEKGKGDGLDPNNKAKIEEIIESDAIDLPDEAYSSINDPIESLGYTIIGIPIPPSLPDVRISSFAYYIVNSSDDWNCSSTVDGNTTDADDDEIPVNASYTFECSKRSATYTGKLSLKDKNDESKNSGFIVCTGTLNGQCSMEALTLKESSLNMKIEKVFYIDGNKTGEVYNFSEFYFKWTQYNNDSVVGWALIESSDLSFKPVGDRDDIFEEGVWNGKISLRFNYENEEGNCTVTFSNLHVKDDDNCPAVSGAFELVCQCPQSTNTSRLLLEWNKCESVGFSLRGC